MSASSRTGERTSAPSIAIARARRSAATTAIAAHSATTTTPALGSGPVRAARAITAQSSSTLSHMPSAKLAAAAGLAALSLSACGIAAKPEAGTLVANAKTLGLKRV